MSECPLLLTLMASQKKKFMQMKGHHDTLANLELFWHGSNVRCDREAVGKEFIHIRKDHSMEPVILSPFK